VMRVGDEVSPAVPETSCGSLAGGSDLWGPRALARAKSRDANTPLANEEILLRRLREKVGPHGDTECLRGHLRAARGKLHWSANGYFRECVTTPPVVTGSGHERRDFEPKPALGSLIGDEKGDENRTPSTSDTTDENTGSKRTTSHATKRQINVPSLPPLCWEKVLARSCLLDAVHLARVNAETREAAGSDTVWRAQFSRRWGEVAAVSLEQRASSRKPYRKEDPSPVEKCPSPEEGQPQGQLQVPQNPGLSRIEWHREYRQRHVRDRNLTCPECLTSKVTPVVYGFPSPKLVDATNLRTVQLGGDYLVEGDPVWACRACQSRWAAWPFASNY